MHKPDSRISYITIGVTRFELMCHFYEALGFNIWRQSDKPEHPFCMFSSGSIILALYPKHLLAKQSGCNISGFNTALSLSLNVKERSDVNHYLETAKAYGAEITRQAFTPDWGGYCGYFKDPEKNLWEIVWHEDFDWTGKFV
ncbi:MAG: Unknown protein [uncultured Thiotrichaceae bacterium]|uniref:VOC domain-containing protein n=1 Tax=uncultured Thiotrichaceae bacterium TaxID=298394 RepID=A0A6S6TE54_9GAMM|nr:MAG: Unknown protein [uncultured Thiotrichaceae bacterium]